MKSFLIVFILFIFVSSTTQITFGQGEIKGTIYSQGEFHPLEVSLVKFQTKNKWPAEESLAVQITDVIQKDLSFSMFFKFSDENLFSFADAADLNPLDQDIWLRTEAQFFIAGKVEIQSALLKTEVYLYDAFARKKKL